MHTAVVLTLLGCVLVALHVWLECLHRRGILHYRLGATNHRSAGTALLELNAIARPKMHHVQQAIHAADARRASDAQAEQPSPPASDFWR